jgi:glycerol-3-phosphate acyltransferase PlsY
MAALFSKPKIPRSHTMNIYVMATVCALGGYLLGSIPFGFLAAKMAGIDIRSVGSGNIGATNVLRTGRKDLAAMTFLGDTGKGAVAVGLAYLFLSGPDEDTRHYGVAIAGACAFLGHLFPVWLNFKGGKGVATFMGTLLAAAWPMGLLAAATWLFAPFWAICFLCGLISKAAKGLPPLWAPCWPPPGRWGCWPRPPGLFAPF